MYRIKSPAEYMLVDMALMSYLNGMHAQRMLGDLAMRIEYEFFGVESPWINLEARYGRDIARQFPVEEMLEKARVQLQGLLDRANRMMIRNLRALRDLQGGSLVIRAEQVNIASQQINQQVVD